MYDKHHFQSELPARIVNFAVGGRCPTACLCAGALRRSLLEVLAQLRVVTAVWLSVRSQRVVSQGRTSFCFGVHLIVTVLLMVTTHVVVARADQGSDLALVESLAAATEQWLNDVEFTCSYRRSYGRAATVEDAMTGQWAVEFEDQRVTGVFAKLGAIMRCSGDLAHPPLVEGDDGASFKTVRFIDYDEASSADVLLDYRPLLDPRNPLGSATFLARNGTVGSSSSRVGRFSAGSNSCRQPNAITLGGTEPDKYLSAPDGATSASRSVVQVDKRRITVLVKFERRGMATERHVEFRLGGSVPVVEKLWTDDVKAGRRFEERAQAFDFVECPGGPVPRVVRCAFNNTDPTHPNLPWGVFEWKSEDLGMRQPTPDDFLVPIAKGTVLRGLKNSSAVLTNGKLDITKVSLDDLDRGAEVAAVTELAETTGPERQGDSLTSWLVWGNVAIVVVVVCFLTWRRVRSGTPRPNDRSTQLP